MGDLDRLIGILSREEGALSLVPLSDEGAKAWHARIKPQTREGDSLPLSYSQERIWFLGQLGPGGANWPRLWWAFRFLVNTLL